MITKLREYFIGDFLRRTDDVFEKARILMLYRFAIAFAILFTLPLATDIAMRYDKGTVLHSIDVIAILYFFYLFRTVKSIDRLINLFFILSFVSSLFSFMIFNPEKIDKIGLTWSFTFLILSSLMQKGRTRLFFVGIVGWIPIGYVYINVKLGGILTIPFLEQQGVENPPSFLVLIPLGVTLSAIWSHTGTIRAAKETITKQKEIIEEKNKDITDSIVYAKRIQQSLLPTDKYIEKNLDRLNKR